MKRQMNKQEHRRAKTIGIVLIRSYLKAIRKVFVKHHKAKLEFAIEMAKKQQEASCPPPAIYKQGCAVFAGCQARCMKIIPD